MNIIITGATKGIGRAITLALAKEGYNLFLTARSLADLQALELAIKQKHKACKVFIHAADLALVEDTQLLASAIKQNFAKVDVFIHNAGLFIPGQITTEPANTLQNQMQVNVFSAYDLTQRCMPEIMAAEKAHLFFMCSAASVQPHVGAGSYSATKYALYGLANNLREELRDKGVKVTTILPGPTYTSSWQGHPAPAEVFVQPEDIAKAIVYTLHTSDYAGVDELRINPIADINNIK